MTNVASKEEVHYFSREASVFPPLHAESQSCQSGDGRNEVRSTNGRREGAAAAARVTFHQATRFSATTAASGTRAGGRDPAELIWLFHGCAAVWLLEEEPRSFWTVSLNAASLPVMERCSRTPRDGRKVAERGLIGMGRGGGVCADVSGAVRVCVS